MDTFDCVCNLKYWIYYLLPMSCRHPVYVHEGHFQLHVILQIDATNFSLCLVAYEGADEVSYRYKFRLRKIPFLFHAYSRTSGVKPCNLYNSPVNLGTL